MAEVTQPSDNPNPASPLGESIEQQRGRLRDVQRKLEEGAARNQANREAREREGKTEPVKESLAKRLTELGVQRIPGSPTGVERIPEGPRPVGNVFRQAIIPDRFVDVSFGSFHISTPSQRTALAATKHWAEAAAARHGRHGLMLALIGPPGVGKSHLLYAAANYLMDCGEKPYARGWYRLADEIRYGGESAFVRGRMVDASEVRAELWRARILLIDEIRPTAGTAFDDTELAKLACHAYDRRLAVMITTNVNPLADVMGPPAASRFTQVVIDGPDRRQA